MAEGHRVLIVDGDAARRNVMANIVRAIGDTPVEVCSHENATKLLSKSKTNLTLKIDYFLVNLVIPLSNDDIPSYTNGVTLIDKIRKIYPRSIEYPIIALKDCSIGNDKNDELTEAAMNRFLRFIHTEPGDIDELRQAIKRLTDKAYSRRNGNDDFEDQKGENTPPLNDFPEKYKILVDLKKMEVYFNGIKLPSGKGGLQQRHKVFLFILARNPDRAMSHEEIHKEIRKFFLRDFKDRPSNIRSQIRKVLKDLAEKRPDKITDFDINSLFITESEDKTILTLPEEEIFTIYGDEEYPSSL